MTAPEDRRRVFIKVRCRDRGDAALRWVDIESTALSVLRGLAVPSVICGRERAALVRCLRDRGVDLPLSRDKALFMSDEGAALSTIRSLIAPTVDAALGVWAHCLEQLTAFRCHQLIYTDIKISNLVGAARPSPHVRVVDFDRVIPLTRRPNWRRFGVSLGYDPPELRRGQRPIESACVYQLAVLLVHLMTGRDNRSFRTRECGRDRLKRQLRRHCLDEVRTLLDQCLDEEPTRRPQTYLAVYEQFAAAPLNRRTRRLWDTLRRPFAERLADLGLSGPEPI